MSIGARSRLAALGVAGLIALAACSGGDPDLPDDSPDGADGELQTLTVASSRVSHLAAILLGVEQGFFEDEGIDLQLDLDSADLTGVPAVASGRVDIGNADLVTLLSAVSEGIGVTAILPASASTGVRGDDYGALLVGPDSTIQGAAELEGRTVSSNSLTNIAALAVREAVRADGGDPSQIELVEVAFPDVPTALETGTIDAAWVIEPFKSAAIDRGARVIAWGFSDIAPEVTVSSWITSPEFAAENPDLVSAFKRAAQTSYEYARENPDEAKAIIPTFTQIDAEVAAAVTLTSWKDELTVAEIEAVLVAAQDFGLITSDPDISALVFDD